MTKSIEEQAKEYAAMAYASPKEKVIAMIAYDHGANWAAKARDTEIEKLTSVIDQHNQQLSKCCGGNDDKIKQHTQDCDLFVPANQIKARDAQWSAVVNELREALKKISDYSTLDGEKYNSYQDGWHGVADFAKREFAKADQMLKEMGIE